MTSTRSPLLHNLFFFLALVAMMPNLPIVHGFLLVQRSFASPSSSLSPTTLTRKPTESLPLFAHTDEFKQQPGESDMDFIKRITNKSINGTVGDTSPRVQASSNATTSSADKKPRGTYKRIEEWDEERKASGELSWEEKVQFEGQRFGNGVRQNEILQKHIGTFF
mmetsp:Transcript_8260/g.15246  ORF Transcript_8260/g.15246 Transcript_8260/m.15246 type:complete len:165 (-) Transcript_8260:240-734(-)